MANIEGFTFAGTDWNDRTNFILQGFDPGIAPKRYRWISGADSDGALSPDETHYDNAEMTVRIRIAPQASMDNALTKIGTLVQALQEAEKQPLGSAAVWTPKASTKSLTAYVLGGEVDGLPITSSGEDAGWFLNNPAPVITLKLIRRPFLYGAQQTSFATVTNTDPCQTLTLASVPGDVDAEATLRFTDGASQSRRFAQWGLEQRYYNAATNLIVDSDNMVTSGFGGTGTTRSGAYDPGAAGNSVIRGTLTTNPSAICGVGNLSHVGTFRVKARVYAAPTSDATATDFKVRLTWKEGDGSLRSNAYASPTVVNGWSEIDLGVITIPEKALGTQRWTGQIEAYSEDQGDTLDVDYLFLIPAGEGYGKARAIVTFETATAFLARDEFDQAAGNLNGKTLPVGGTWATSVAATDLAVEATGHTVQRTAAGAGTYRFAIASLAGFASQLVQVDYRMSDFNNARAAVVARWTDATHWLLAYTNGSQVIIEKNNAGIVTLDTSAAVFNLVASDKNAWFSMRMAVYPSGMYAVWLFRQGNPAGSPVLVGTHSDLATGGTLASGQVGFADMGDGVGAITRSYDNFFAAAATPDAVIFSGRSAEIRHDRAERADSTGTYYGPIQTYRGPLFYVPPAGSAGRTSRVFGSARRNDIDLAADDQIADSTTLTVDITPRYYVAPR